ncbi:MAG: hypothetical protein EHM33_00500 [Chloroflexi bacterium]|nr:MAG: hypothetical protein EHM33_00500 [Chloroflexota bacterium]
MSDEKIVKKPQETFKKYAAKYGKLGHNGDQIATLFAENTKEGGKVSRDKLLAIAEANGLDLNKWQHLNLGMQRMNLGNALRGMYNKGKPVIVGGVTVAPAENAA